MVHLSHLPPSFWTPPLSSHTHTHTHRSISMSKVYEETQLYCITKKRIVIITDVIINQM